ncbi:response regulator [Jannaschia formosa]|uniref:response regulator n=1 Tax=Jannaschia formosa TaxID=2259592 RepID=UPI000E1B77D1|nr:response regulator [Jannaschia formosa]TFL17287.1 response regulator [Jannaschia formosa]
MPAAAIVDVSVAGRDRKSTSWAGTAASGQHSAEPRRPLRVVVVEDDAIIAMELEMMLQDLGVEVLGIATTAAEAIRLVEQHRPDCATMDINIRGERDGISAAIEIYELLGVRSIFATAYGNPETVKRAAPAHPIGWVKKPFEAEDLKSALRQVLKGN